MPERSPNLPLRCPRCTGTLVSDVLGWVCVGCTQTYSDAEGFMDMLPDVVEPPQRGLGPAAMEHPLFAKVYESAWRPLYMSVARGGLADLEMEIDCFLDHLANARGGLCMDLSCGPGVVGRQLLARGHFARVFGLDYSAAMLRQCLDHCAREGVQGFELVRGDAGNLPLCDASVDAVHAGNALHLWPDVRGSLAEVARVLKPGGAFVATTFVRACGWRRSLSTRFERATATRFFDDGELDAACESVGLVDFASKVQGNSIWLRASAPDGQAQTASS